MAIDIQSPSTSAPVAAEGPSTSSYTSPNDVYTSHKYDTTTTAQQLVNQPSDVSATTGLTLSEQIAADFAALQAISGGSDVTGSGGPYTVPVPVPVQKSSSATTWILLLIGAGIVAYFLLRKKRE